jgi:putative transposase
MRLQMNKQQKEDIAVFRFGVISEFIGGISLEHGEREQFLKEKSSRKWDIPYSNKTRISRGTILRWIRLYKRGNNKLKALYPNGRDDNGKSRTLDSETKQAIIDLRKELPEITIPYFIKEIEKRDLVSNGIKLNLSLVYRFLKSVDMMRPNENIKKDRRKFEAESPNDMWQSDIMHGPRVLVKDRKRKTYLIAFIDDHSRLVPYAGFYLSENLASFLKAFKLALLTRGAPRKLYVDNGSAYRSKQLERISAELGIALIHAKPYQPQSKGKVERFFKTVRNGFLNSYNPEELDGLNKDLQIWLKENYHNKRHRGTSQTPFERFTAKIQCIREAPSDLADYFRYRALRTVAKDRSVILNGRQYEAPVCLIGKRIELLYHENTPETVDARYQDKNYGKIKLINLNVNYKVRRDKNRHQKLEILNSSKYAGGKLWNKGDK